MWLIPGIRVLCLQSHALFLAWALGCQLYILFTWIKKLLCNIYTINQLNYRFRQEIVIFHTAKDRNCLRRSIFHNVIAYMATVAGAAWRPPHHPPVLPTRPWGQHYRGVVQHEWNNSVYSVFVHTYMYLDTSGSALDYFFIYVVVKCIFFISELYCLEK